MKENIIGSLTSKDNKCTWDTTNKIICESKLTDKWYQYIDDFFLLINHPNSLVRNRVINIIAANAHWDDENKFDSMMPALLRCVIDEKPITARQCIKALAKIGSVKPQYIPQILNCFNEADLSKYKDSMRPLIEKDMTETIRVLTQLEQR